MQTETMPGDDDVRRKSQVFFDRGKTVAEVGNFEYAIDMYIGGLALDPDNVDAHRGLREVGVKRTAVGGKPMGLFDKMKMPKPQDDKARMLAAEKLLAYEPGNSSYMTAMHHAAQAGGFVEATAWIERILNKALADLR